MSITPCVPVLRSRSTTPVTGRASETSDPSIERTAPSAAGWRVSSRNITMCAETPRRLISCTASPSMSTVFEKYVNRVLSRTRKAEFETLSKSTISSSCTPMSNSVCTSAGSSRNTTARANPQFSARASASNTREAPPSGGRKAQGSGVRPSAGASPRSWSAKASSVSMRARALSKLFARSRMRSVCENIFSIAMSCTKGCSTYMLSTSSVGSARSVACRTLKLSRMCPPSSSCSTT
ncbi:PP146 [Orf virus]|uniref:PP146 n=1 Tax=Orf virus TaxID=10258 RepID=F1AWW0_ORFV|nr:PP146 [Orf virus]